MTLPGRDTPLRRRTMWFLERCDRGELVDDEIREVFALDGATADTWRQIFAAAQLRVDGVVSYTEVAPDVCRVHVESGSEVAVLRLAVTPEADGHRIRYAGFLPDAPPGAGVTIRDADEQHDGASLADLERRCPVRTGTVAVAYDRGDDWFAQQRLMGSHLTSVAEINGAIVGVYSESVRTLAVSGRGEVPIAYHFHLRVDETYRGMRVFPALNAHLLERKVAKHHPYPVAHGFIAVENETMIRTVPEEMLKRSAWSVGIERLVIDCGVAAGPQTGRAASPADAARIAAILAASHGREELAPPFHAAWVRDRFERAPEDFAWSDALVGEAAVVSVWDQRLVVTRTSEDDVDRSVRATVIDWGCEHNAEDELVALLRAWCATLAAAGTTHLTVLSSPTSPDRRVLEALSPKVEPFLLTLNVPEPSDVAERGIYVDPIYF